MHHTLRAGRSSLRAITAAAVLGGVLATAGGASAYVPCDRVDTPCPNGTKTAKGTVKVNAGYTLTVRRRPRAGAKKVRSVKNGTTVTIVCQITGSNVSGTYGTSSLWDKLKRGGYVSDTFIYTGSDGRVAPTCPDPSPAHPHHGTHPTQPEPSHSRPRDVTLSNDYPYKTDSPETADPWGFYHRECTSFVAYRLNRLKGFHFSNRMDGGHFGDAGNWDNNARALGFRVNNTPTVGSVMVRDSGTWGHVAIVAKVTKTRFLVEEYNHNVPHGYGERWLSRAPNSDWDHFIHFRQ